MRFFLVDRHLCDVDHRQNRKDKGLKRPDKDTEALPDGQERNTEQSQLQNDGNQNFMRQKC